MYEAAVTLVAEIHQKLSELLNLLEGVEVEGKEETDDG